MTKKKEKNQTLSKSAAADTEFSGSLSSSAVGRVKEAGYGKATDVELAQADTTQGINNYQDPGSALNNDAQIGSNTNYGLYGQSDNPSSKQDYEFADLDSQYSASGLKNTQSQQNTEYAGELTSENSNSFTGLGNYDNTNYEFGDLTKNPTAKEKNQKNKTNL